MDDREILRREYISSLGISLLAGCGGKETAQSDTPTQSETATNSPTATPAPQTTISEETATQSGPPIPEGQEWTKFQYDASNSGHYPEGVGPYVDPETRWTFNTGTGTFVSVHRNTAYIGTVARDLYAFDITDGSKKWEARPGFQIRRRPTVTDDAVYVGAGDVFAVNPDTGRTNWSFSVEAGTANPPAVADGMMYFTDDHGKSIYAVDTSDRSLQWKRTLPSAMWGVPALDPNHVYVGGSGSDYHLYALDRVTGEIVWKTHTGGPISFRTPAVVDGVVYGGNDGAYAFAINTDDGSVRWSNQVRRSIVTSTTIANDLYYAGTWDGRVYALDIADGTQEWVVKANRRVSRSRPTVYNGTLYFGSDDEHLYAVDAKTGKSQWQQKLDGLIRTPVIPTEDGVFAASLSGSIYRFSHEGNQLWKLRVAGARLGSGATVSDGLLYIGGRDGKGHAIDTSNGDSVWELFVEGDIGSTPAIGKNQVFVCGAKVNAVDKRSGKINWSTRIIGPIGSSPLLADNRVYIGGWRGKVFALNQQDGSIVWESDTDAPVRTVPARGESTLFAGSESGSVYAFSPEDGSEKWSKDIADSLGGSPTAGRKSVYVGDRQDTVYALDIASGETRWTYNNEDGVVASPALADGRLLVPSGGAGLDAIHTDDGRREWEANIPVTGAPVVASERVYVGGHDGLYVLDVTNGEVIHQFDVGGRTTTPPAVVNGTVYVGGGDGVYAISDRRVAQDP